MDPILETTRGNWSLAMICINCGYEHAIAPDQCPLCKGEWQGWELLFAPHALDDLRAQVMSWIGQLPTVTNTPTSTFTPTNTATTGLLIGIPMKYQTGNTRCSCGDRIGLATSAIQLLSRWLLFDLELPLAWKELTGRDIGSMERLWVYLQNGT